MEKRLLAANRKHYTTMSDHAILKSIANLHIMHQEGTQQRTWVYTGTPNIVCNKIELNRTLVIRPDLNTDNPKAYFRVWVLWTKGRVEKGVDIPGGCSSPAKGPSKT